MKIIALMLSALILTGIVYLYITLNTGNTVAVVTEPVKSQPLPIKRTEDTSVTNPVLNNTVPETAANKSKQEAAAEYVPLTKEELIVREREGMVSREQNDMRGRATDGRSSLRKLTTKIQVQRN